MICQAQVKQPVDSRYVALAKQCYHGTLHGSKLLTCMEFRAGKTEADLWGVLYYWDTCTSDKSPSFESDMCQAALMLTEVVVFTCELASTPLDEVLDFARMKGLCVDGNGPTSQKVLADFQCFLLTDKRREDFARLGIDKVLEAFPDNVARSLALHLAVRLCPDEWERLLGAQIAHATSRPRAARTTQAFICYMNDGGRKFLAENGIDALIKEYKASGGEIGTHYASKIVLELFRAEHEAGKSVKKAKSKRGVKSGCTRVFHTFMNIQGGKELLATQGCDVLLKEFRATGRDIERSYAKKLMRQGYGNEYEAGETARAKADKVIEDSMQERD